MINIVNAVGSGNLHLELDLEQLGADLNVPYTEYDPENYHGLYVRFEEDGPLITVYRSGKYIIVGSSSLNELNETNDLFLNCIAELEGISIPDNTGFSIRNIVSTAEIGKELNLNALAIGLGLELVEFEPEQFPGLVYRPTDHPIVFLIFSSGKVVITGATDTDIATDGFEDLQSKINNIT